MCRGYVKIGRIYHTKKHFIGTGYQGALAAEKGVDSFKREADARGTWAPRPLACRGDAGNAAAGDGRGTCMTQVTADELQRIIRQFVAVNILGRV
jgi:hypothetical protein